MYHTREELRAAGATDVEVERAWNALQTAIGSRTSAVVDRAVVFAVAAHRGQYRESGELYATHPLAVATLVAHWGFDEVTVAAAACHDVVEDCGIGLESLADVIGADAASVVDGVSKVGKVPLGTGTSVESASMAKFLAATVHDVRVLVVKLADRLHNLRTSQPLGPERQTRLAREALDVFAPLAHRLGMEELRCELEDLAFELLYPEDHRAVVEHLAAAAASRRAVERAAADTLTELLTSAGVTAIVESRSKHLYSIHRKHQRGVPFDAMHDLVGVRIIVGSRDDCYLVLGVVHAACTPVPGRFRDFIAIPRPSGYQSLHTTVSLHGSEVEVQVRTTAMHLRARFGAAAHFVYKERGPDHHGAEQRVTHSPAVVDAELLDALASASTPEEFLEHLRTDLAPASGIVVLTPKGKPIMLPAGAVVLDFAYKIHTDVGHRCHGARVNGKITPIRTALHTGDVVEVLLGPTPAPNRDWLLVVRTARAREKIRKFLTDHAEDRAALGRTVLREALRSSGAGHVADDVPALARIAAANRYASVDELYRALGERSVLVRDLHGLPTGTTTRRVRKRVGRTEQTRLADEIAAAFDDLPWAPAKCCTVLSVERCAAQISAHRKLVVHAIECASLRILVRDLPPCGFSRVIRPAGTPLRWVEVQASDRTGLLRDLSAVFTDRGVNLLAVWVSACTAPSDAEVSTMARFEVEGVIDSVSLRDALVAVPAVRYVDAC